MLKQTCVYSKNMGLKGVGLGEGIWMLVRRGVYIGSHKVVW